MCGGLLPAELRQPRLRSGPGVRHVMRHLQPRHVQHERSVHHEHLHAILRQSRLRSGPGLRHVMWQLQPGNLQQQRSVHRQHADRQPDWRYV